MLIATGEQSFLTISVFVSTITTFLSLLLLHALQVGTFFNIVPAGPIAIIFSILYQYVRLVPDAYQMKVFGLDLNDKIWVYILAAQVGHHQIQETHTLRDVPRSSPSHSSRLHYSPHWSAFTRATCTVRTFFS